MKIIYKEFTLREACMHLTLQGYYLSRVKREIEIQGDKQKYLVLKIIVSVLQLSLGSKVGISFCHPVLILAG